MKLINQVKPEVLEALDRHCKCEYSSSYRAIIASFNSVNRYKDLTIAQVNNLLTFLPDEYHPDGRTDFYYGDYLLQKEYQV